MKEIFVKKYWEEEDILFYLHFQDNDAVRQIEISEGKMLFLSDKEPIQGDNFLYDQSLDELEFDKNDYISKEEFEEIWAKKER
jgi:hypothetical protein